MLTALSPKEVAIAESQDQRTPAPIPQIEDPISVEDDEDSPSSAWDRSDFEWALVRAIARERESEARSIDESYRTTVLFQADGNAVAWEAFGEYAQLRYGKKGSLAKLLNVVRTLQEQTPISLLGSSSSSPTKVVMFIAPDGSEVKVQERKASGDFEYYSLTRI